MGLQLLTSEGSSDLRLGVTEHIYISLENDLC